MYNNTLPRPRSGRLRDASARYGWSRSVWYELAVKHPGLLKKRGAATIVDYDIADRIVDELPAAQIKAPRRALTPAA
jgi:hypothetical protein